MRIIYKQFCYVKLNISNVAPEYTKDYDLTWFTLSKDIIYIYSGKWNICNKNLQLCPLKRRRGPSFNQSWISLAKWCVVSNLVKIGRAVLDMKSKMWQHLQTDRQTDDSREVVTKSYLIMSFQLRWEKRQQSALVCGIRIKSTCKTLYLLLYLLTTVLVKKNIRNSSNLKGWIFGLFRY